MPDLAPIHHIKIPVSDVRASIQWYQRVLGLTVMIEFTEDGELRGVALKAPDGSSQIALRHEPERAAALAGFDLFAIGVPTRDGVQAWADH
ncbi:MAG: VOC family protein, partial [Nakamurella sp.]